MRPGDVISGRMAVAFALAIVLVRQASSSSRGHIRNELQELVDNPEETDDLLRLGLHRLPLKEFPLLRGLAPDLANYDGEAELERGLDILLTGVRVTYPHNRTADSHDGQHQSDGTRTRTPP